jgi:hypothetical protein
MYFQNRFCQSWRKIASDCYQRFERPSPFADSQSTRVILRRLDKIIAFPEETALLLRDYERRLFGQVTVSTLLAGLTHNLAVPKQRRGEWIMQNAETDLKLFQKFVSHFYLVRTRERKCSICNVSSNPISGQVSEWILQLIISQSGHTSRRAALACVLRIAQESWNIGNFNAVMEILLGLR